MKSKVGVKMMDMGAHTNMGKPTMKKGMSMAKDGMKKATPMAKPRMAAVSSMPGVPAMKKGGMCGGGMAKKMAKGGSVDGCASKGKTKGRMV